MAGPPPLKATRVQPVPPPLNSPQGRALVEERLAAEAQAKKQLPGWRRFFRKATMWLFLILLGCIVMQIGLAGAGVLGDDQYPSEDTLHFIDAHRTLVHAITLLAVLIVAAGFLGADKEAGWVGVGLFFLVGFQYPLILEFTGVVRSFHVLNALIIFTLALLMTLARIPWRPHFLDGPAPPTAPKA